MADATSELLQIYRHDFASFTQRAFLEINPDEALDWNWSHDLICHCLNRLEAGDARRQMVLIPPRSLKSFICTNAWTAFLIGRRPSAKLIAVSYSQTLADDHSRLVIKLMQSDWYKAVFPETRLASAKPAAEQFFTTAGGYRLATSVGGTLTGRGAERIIIDDPIKAEDAASEAIRNSVNAWYLRTARSRLNHREFGQILLVMQRLHQNDLAGMLMEKGGWEILKLAAIAEQEEEHPYRTIAGPAIARRSVGDPLHPERDSLEVWQEILNEVGSYDFNAQYQQNPQPLEGNIVKRAWFRSYPADCPLPPGARVVQAWDTAGKTGATNDFSVCTTWALLPDGQIWLWDVYRDRVDQPTLQKLIPKLAKRFNAERVLIEDSPVAIGLIQGLRQSAFYRLVPKTPKGDKRVRLISISPMIENGFVYLPSSAPWLDCYVDELTAFPGAKFDDQVDSTTLALAVIREEGLEPAIITYYREEAEAKARRDVPSVRLRAPPGVSHAIMMDGHTAVVGPDGCVVVSPANAAAMVAGGYVEEPLVE